MQQYSQHVVIMILWYKSLGLAYQTLIALGSQMDQPCGLWSGYLVTTRWSYLDHKPTNNLASNTKMISQPSYLQQCPVIILVCKII